ncbi:hypothetical protein J1N35_011620 [Gossypium stocksii]|uniref:DUF7745 domain-containing protein n=1 Tax=Gossypium stocksii TaxID=47602 RepID=A0A9D3W3Z6_9ROSI|nr:hypothetical protein J1N35_011620 [Gossypium stocksii]
MEKVSYRVFSENYSPLKELVATLRRGDISKEKWMAILQNLQVEDVEWRAPWMIPDEILYWYGNFDWVPLLGMWGAVGYGPLLVLRQFRSRQFIPVTEENTRTDQWEKKFHDTRVREDALKKSLLESQNEKERLRARMAELEKSLDQHRSRNSVIELKASLIKIEELKGRIEEFETALQNCELWVELLEANNEHWKEKLYRSQDQFRNRDYVIGEALAQSQIEAES